MLTWDRSHDYALHRFWNDLTRVTIRFRNAPPSVGELVAQTSSKRSTDEVDLSRPT